jgi:DNA excision repair protein ERCC-2
MAISLSKLFMRTISQNPMENQTGVSLWTIEDVAKAQEKQKALALELEKVQEREEEYDDGGIADHMLEDLDLDV